MVSRELDHCFSSLIPHVLAIYRQLLSLAQGTHRVISSNIRPNDQQGMSTMDNTRRRFVIAFSGGVLAIPLGALMPLQHAGAAETPKLSPDDPSAKALAYTHQSSVADKICEGCQLYTGETAAQWGACAIFPQKLVSANGVCNSWFKRTG